MGCCLTTAAAGDSKTNSKPRDSPPPPPAGFVEETVKEVLSETPVTYKQPSPPPPPSNCTPRKTTGDDTKILHPEEGLRSKDVIFQKTNNPIEENASDISSEIYSYTASYSAATTTTTIGTGIEIEIDEDGEVTQKVNKPSPAKMVPRRQQALSSGLSGERSRRKERGIRPPPPARRTVVRSTDKKPLLPSRNLTAEQRHRNLVPSTTVVRREPPARRSMSPAPRGEAARLRKVKDKSPVRKSGNRVPVNVTENEVHVKLKITNDSAVMPVAPEPEPEPSESLENPLVSLECFIFL